MTTIVTPLIGASDKMVWKPVNAVGSASDALAPFELGTTAKSVQAYDESVFCRVAAAGIAIGGTAGITAGVTVTAAAGNTFKNNTGVALIVGDYCFLQAAGVLSP